MTWAPRNKSEDEDEDDGDGERKEVERSEKTLDNSEASAEDEGISLHVDTLTDHSCSAESDVEKVNVRSAELRSSVDDGDDVVERHLDTRGHVSPKPITSSPLTGVEAPILSPHHLHQLHHHLQREDLARSLMAGNKALESRAQPQNPTVKPKLWSLAEIATSDPKQQSSNCPSSSGGLLTAPTSAASPPSLYPPPSIIGRPIYYTSPFYSNYTNYGNFSPLQGQGILRYNSSGVSLAAAAAAAAAAASSSSSSSSSSSANEALSSTQHHHNQHSEAKLRPESPLSKNNNSIVEQLPHQHFRSAIIEAKKGT